MHRVVVDKCFAAQAKEFFIGSERAGVAPGQLVNQPGAGVMPCVRMLRAWISQPHNQLHAVLSQGGLRVVLVAGSFAFIVFGFIFLTFFHVFCRLFFLLYNFRQGTAGNEQIVRFNG